MNATIEKFGYPASLVREYRHWVVLARPAQPTLGSLVLAAKGESTAFGDLDPAAHAELSKISADIERGLSAFCRFERINYLMLMMVDPHVHFHVIPRYEGSRSDETGLSIADRGWPALPDLAQAVRLDDNALRELANRLGKRFASESNTEC